jgi:carboxylesterase type B
MMGSGTRSSGAAVAAVVAMLAGLLAACSDSSDSSCATGVVDTTIGKVCGVVLPVGDLDGVEVDAFLGIPFAESTAGANRFQPPVPKARLDGVLAADTLSPACPQVLNPPQGATSISEDCLTVNVWRPTDLEQGGRRPVMLWIYGGSFTSGANQYPVYQGDYIAAKENVVVVALNYRLGALGFLAGIDGLTGNYGLMDQQLAMRWVRDNIDRFGGDPDQITIFGESAGAMSVGLHELSIPSSAGLFRAAIQQSNPLGIPYKSLTQAAPSAALLAAKVGCSGQGLECLQNAPVDAIVAEQSNVQLQLLSLLGARLAGFLVFAPVVDGSFLVLDPTVAASQTGLEQPTLMGTNESDGTIFIAEIVKALGGTLREAQYLLVLNLLFGPEYTSQIVALYGSNPTGDNSAILSQIATDYLFGCANRYVARTARSDIYVYRFDETSLNVWPDVPACDDQACHADDVPFTFHVDKPLGFTFTAAQAELSDAMVGYWTSFAEHLNPNGDGRLEWPFFTPDGLEYMLLDTPLSTTVSPIANCDFWDSIGYEIDTPVRVMNEQATRALAAE